MPAASRPSKSRRPSGMRPGRRPRLDRRAWPRLHGQPVHPFTPQARTACPAGAHLRRRSAAIPIDKLVTGDWEVVGSKGKLLSFKGFRRGWEERPSPTASESSDFLSEVTAILTQ